MDAEPTRGSSGLDREAGEIEDHPDDRRSSRAQDGVEHEIIKSSLHPLRDDVRILQRVNVKTPPKDTKEDEIVVVAVDTHNRSLEPNNRKEDIAKIFLDFFGRGGRYAVLREKMPNVNAITLLQYGREIFDIEKIFTSRYGQEIRFNPVTELWGEMNYQVWHSKDSRFSKWKMHVAYFKMSEKGDKLLETDMLFISIHPENAQPSPPKKEKALTQSRESKTAPVTPVKSQGNGRMTISKTTEFHSESIDEEKSTTGSGRSFNRPLSASSSSSDALFFSPSQRDGGRDSDRYREKSSKDRYRGRSRSRSPRRSRSRSRSGDRDRSQRDRYSPSRRSHRERGRDDRDYGSRSHRRDRTSPAQEDGGSSSGGLRDMGLDETNRMRIQLGLPPLTAEADEPAAPSNDAMDVDERPPARNRPASSQYSAEEAEEEVDINTLSVEERILYLKKKRLEKAKQKRMQKTLADDDDDTEQYDDPLAWVQRSKKLEEERKKAAKKAKELFGDDEEEEEASSKPTADSSGLKVNHDIGDFKAGETVILTLKDKQILDKGRLAADADDDELEAVAFVEEEKAKKFREAKQKKSRYVNFDDETDPRNASGILSKYDDDQKKGGFVIGAPDASIAAAAPAPAQDDDRVAQIRRKLMSEPSSAPTAAPSVKAPSLLDDFALPGAVGSDYYTAEETNAQQADAEAEQKKKEKQERRQKKRKLRSRGDESTNDVFASLTPLGNEDADSELGSRADRQARAAQRELDQMRENASNIRKFEQAVESANTAVEASWFKGGKSGATVLRHDEEAEELEYLKKLQRTKESDEKDRESRMRADEEIVSKVAESLKRRKPLLDDDNIKLEDMEIETEDQGLTFTATDEFVRGIGSMQDIKEEEDSDVPMEDEAPVIRPPPAKRIKQEEPDSDDMELDDDVAGSSRASAVSGEEDEDGGVDAIMGPARVESKGIAGFLSQLRSEGAATLEDYTTTYAGRVTDKKRGTDAIPSEMADEDEDDPNVIHDPNFKFKFKLEYRDKQGRIQTKKEAWRELGQAFHNKKPGKKKLEQRLKREKEEIARKKKMTSDQALQSVQKLQKIQAKMQSPFVVVTSNAQKLVAMREGEKFKNVEIDEIPLRKPASAQAKRSAAAPGAQGAQSSSSSAPHAQAAPSQQPPQNRPKIEIQLKPRPQQ